MSAWRVAAALTVACGAAACGTGSTTPGTYYRNVAGSYTGTLSSGAAVAWTLAQQGNQVSGNGTYEAAGAAGAIMTYTLRGVALRDSVTLRLVGAPGDSDADSVVYAAAYQIKYYQGNVLDGLLSGGQASPLSGMLTMYYAVGGS